jgi:hypothetical protein
LVTDCGGSSTAYFPCSLITPQEVGAALGEKIEMVQPLPPDRCRYFPENPLDFITIKAASSGARAEFEGSRLGARLLGLKPTEQSAGIGDESFWQLSVIWVRKGDAYLNIDMKQAPVDQQAVGLKLAQPENQRRWFSTRQRNRSGDPHAALGERAQRFLLDLVGVGRTWTPTSVR